MNNLTRDDYIVEKLKDGVGHLFYTKRDGKYVVESRENILTYDEWVESQLTFAEVVAKFNHGLATKK